MKLISWNTTKRCNLNCKHCYRDSKDKKYYGELNTNQGFKLIDEIKSVDFQMIIFSGGEPLLREDIFELISYATKKDVIATIGTNATLIDENIAKKLKNSGLKAAAVSVDHCLAKEHDLFRGKEGAFELTLNGIKNLQKEGIRVQINTTITKQNENQIVKMAKFAEDINAKSFHPFYLVEVGRGKNLFDMSLSPEIYLKSIENILKKRDDFSLEIKPTCAPQFMSIAKKMNQNLRFSRGCIAGISYCCILPNGEVNICPYLPIKVGNVKNDNFKKIWLESEVFNNLRDIKNYKGNCSKCKDFNICGGCRARAFSKTNDFFQEDPVSNFCFKSR